MKRNAFRARVAEVVGTLNDYKRWHDKFQSDVGEGVYSAYSEEGLRELHQKKRQAVLEDTSSRIDLMRGYVNGSKIKAKKKLQLSNADAQDRAAASTIARNTLDVLQVESAEALPEKVVGYHRQMLEEGASPVEVQEFERLAKLRLRDEPHWVQIMNENAREHLSAEEIEARRVLEQAESLEEYLPLLENEVKFTMEQLEKGRAESGEHLLRVWDDIERSVWAGDTEGSAEE